MVAVGNAVQLKLLAALDLSPLCPRLLQKIVSRPFPVISYHLRILRQAGVVSVNARSNFRVYRATPFGSRVRALARTVGSRFPVLAVRAGPRGTPAWDGLSHRQY
jgi:DNA-binding transcriptional ArsR family regulator